MSEKKEFRVYFKITAYDSVVIEAIDEDEAWEIAEQMDTSELDSSDPHGGWVVDGIELEDEEGG